MKRFFKDDTFDLLFRVVLGSTARECADPGEVFACHARIKDGKPDSWFEEWVATASHVEGIASAAEAAGHAVSARCAYLRASTYYSTATFMSDQSKDPAAFMPTWERHRDCWEKAINLWPVPVESVAIPYEDTALHGYLFRPDASDQARPLLILISGSEGSMTSAWVQGAGAAIERGYCVLVFDGPGQQAALFRRGLHFRPDWEHVVTPIVDFLLERNDVDGQRIALLGMSQAGYWAARALAFEKRIAAGVVDPGVVDVGAMWRDQMPERIIKYVDARERDKFERDMGVAFKMMKGLKARIEFRMRPFGVDSLYDVLVALEEYRLGDLAKEITCPMLITNPEDDKFWPGQSQQLFDALECDKEIVSFTSAEGADHHCEPLSTYLREQRIFDWLDSKLA
ncbi:MAG: hypothetical protein DCC49_07995 [Acidobacteria bacterium]|nr:MAG: hypothetical protein DCC49_07995 [Acidobacteriota bacterium]